MTAAQLASRTRLDVNRVSAQRTRLVKEAVVEKVPYPPGKRAGFQAAAENTRHPLHRAAPEIRRAAERVLARLTGPGQET
jgi:hypothetical protein